MSGCRYGPFMGSQADNKLAAVLQARQRAQTAASRSYTAAKRAVNGAQERRAAAVQELDAAVKRAVEVAQERRAAALAELDAAVSAAQQEHDVALAVLGAAVGDDELTARGVDLPARVVAAARRNADAEVVAGLVQELGAPRRRQRPDIPATPPYPEVAGGSEQAGLASGDAGRSGLLQESEDGAATEPA